MRIQHNIMAMNAYRNYTNNVSAMKKNLEKLSSGYKINRAGDDAAGLAISEKMRAQITGLETAQKNAKDGISLVQTAEGALTEVHDMLNRMVELATQSANGTYDNTTDRAQMQKEVNQLREEINRIADSANFNGIKLFDGTMEANRVEGEVYGLSDLAILSTDTTNAVAGSDTKTILHVPGRDATKTKFTVDLENVTLSNTTATAVTSGGISIGGATLTCSIAGTTSLSGADLATALMKTKTEIAIGGVSYSISADGGKLVFEMSKSSFDALKNDSTKTASFTGNFQVDIVSTGLSQAGSVNRATQIITEGGPNQPTTLAQTKGTTAYSKTNLTDGLTIGVGGTNYVFALSKTTLDGVKAAGGDFVAIDLTDIVNANGVLDDSKVGHGDAVSEALSRLTVAAKDNKMFTVGQTADYKLFFQEKASYNGDGKDGRADLTTHKGIQGQLQTGAFQQKTIAAAKGNGTGLTLQIGDTADSFNQLKVSLGDMHVSSLGIEDMSIADQASAAVAVDKIKAAINQVSDVRGTLGATQNRLDHTINNLGVMTENIQDAESTIRDVDIAEEMMAYTKNNILIQSAQAMLAQANQVPQGVLQLLG